MRYYELLEFILWLMVIKAHVNDGRLYLCFVFSTCPSAAAQCFSRKACRLPARVTALLKLTKEMLSVSFSSGEEDKNKGVFRC